MTDLVLDLTGELAANKVSLEDHSILLDVDRLIVPTKGAFYSKGLIVKNVANGQILFPNVDYNLYEIEPQLFALTGGNAVYKLIHITNRSVALVQLTYHAVGGSYQYTPDYVTDILTGYITGGDGTYPWGHISQKPVSYPPEMHLQDMDTVFDAQRLVMSVEHIAQAITQGDLLAVSAINNYVEVLADDYYQRTIAVIDGLEERIDNTNSITASNEGEFLITDNPENPAVRKGGYWILNPDILLYGANDVDHNIGDLIPVAAGSDLSARRTYIWKRGEDLGQVTFQMAASTTGIDEGEAATLTLTTTGLPSGTQVPYRITGSAGFNSSDIAPTPINGRFVVNASGIGTLVITAVEDSLTENNESFTVALTSVANVSRTITINDTSKSPGLSVRFSSASNGSGTITQANEGDTVYLVIESSNLPDGHEVDIDYSQSTGNVADFSAALPATATITSGLAIVSYTIELDRLTEGNESFIPAVSSTIITTPVQKTLTIRDTSKTPTYNMHFTPNSNGSGTTTTVNEGGTVYLVITTTEVDPGTVFDLLYTGDATNADFTATRPSTATLGPGGTVTIPFTTVADNTTEGAEGMNVVLSLSGSQLKTASISIIDTSQNPNYVVDYYSNSQGSGTPLSQVNEGQTFYFVLKTTGVASGHEYQVEYAGTANGADFTTTRPSIMTIGSNGTGSILMTTKNDFLLEGLESLSIIVKDGVDVVATKSININDTSVAAGYNLNFSSSSSGSPVVTSVNEGGTVYLCVSATNVPNGTVLDLSYPTGAGLTTGADFATTRPLSITLNAQGKGSASFNLKNDVLSEGVETLRVVAARGATTIGTFDVNINDTSIPKVVSRFSANANGSGTITQANEGQMMYLVLDTQGFADGTTLTIENSGMADSQFVGDNPATSVVVSANASMVGTSIISYQSKADLTTESNQTLTIKVKPEVGSSTTYATTSILVKDTSKTPTYSTKWMTAATGGAAITSSEPGTTRYFVIETTNLPNGTELQVDFDDSTYAFSNLATPPVNQTVTISNNRAVIPVDLTLFAANWRIRFQGASGDYPEITNRNEGQTFVLYGEDLENPSDSLWFAYPYLGQAGHVSASDFTAALPIVATPTLDGQAGTFTLVNDTLTEGAELFTVEVYFDEALTQLARTCSITINDTSENAEVVMNISNSADYDGVNLLDLYTATYGAPDATTKVHFNITSSANLVGSEFGDTAPIVIDYWPTGSQVRITNNGTLVGMGGRGGSVETTPDGASVMTSYWTPGGNGGPAIIRGTNPDHTVVVTNGGLIAGGAGGGGCTIVTSGGVSYSGNPGGGGAGYISGISGGDQYGNGGRGANADGTLSTRGHHGNILTGGAGTSNVVSGKSSGKGGDAGYNGSRGYTLYNNTRIDDDPSNNPGLAGHVSVGSYENLTIHNTGSGITRGR